ncbi:MAG: SgcJ/EcaC family oxidoreductase [Chloroflexi bacterium]|nr:SgcJ/EcaC family oxidoreductase [Chloroflexota bacterium]OJV89577.1 MAG: hypothetical protein BGO39_37095 [Chloroflexi bacterium 54-19]
MEDKTQIRELVENWARAIREQDLESVFANHAGNVVMFDVPPPLQLKGMAAYKASWEPFFEAQQKGLFNLGELTITAGEDVAFCHSIVTCGTGPENSFEVRLTIGLKKIDGQWLITHEHHSVPAQ